MRTVEADTHVIRVFGLGYVGLVRHTDCVVLRNLVHLTLVREQDPGLSVPKNNKGKPKKKPSNYNPNTKAKGNSNTGFSWPD